MRIEKDWKVCPATGRETFVMRAFIGHEVLGTEHSREVRDYGAVVPLDIIERELRRNIMREIERQLFRGHP